MSSAHAASSRIELFGISICNLSYDDLFEIVSRRVESRTPGYIVTPNVDHVCRYHKNPEFREAYDNACEVLPDGMPIMWSSHIFGRPLRQKLSGSDLLPRLCEFAAERGYSVFFLGAGPGVAEEVAELYTTRFPGLQIKGTYSPPYGFEKNPEANAEVIRRVREAEPDLVFVALGSPKQELWLHANCEACGAPLLFGVGAAFDFAAGRVRRAPVWMQNAGLEWLWRVAMEPRRLARRYLVEDAFFFVLFWREFRKRKLGRVAKSV